MAKRLKKLVKYLLVNNMRKLVLFLNDNGIDKDDILYISKLDSTEYILLYYGVEELSSNESVLVD